MRVCLYGNENAGEGISLEETTRLIKRFGHTVTQVIHHRAELPKVIGSVDCVAAAGGDGTVGRLARALAGGPIPMAILPLGTANNIAGSLSIEGELEHLIERWSDQDVVSIDVGVLHDARGDSYFLEGVGSGLIAQGIRVGRDADLKQDGNDADLRLARARRIFLDALDRLQPRRYSITIDEATIEDEFLLVEILNMPSIGPGIRLSPEASPADGLLSVVVAGESDRHAIASYLREPVNGDAIRTRLDSWRATTVTLRAPGALHVDDEVREMDREAKLSVSPASLRVLA